MPRKYSQDQIEKCCAMVEKDGLTVAESLKQFVQGGMLEKINSDFKKFLKPADSERCVVIGEKAALIDAIIQEDDFSDIEISYILCSILGKHLGTVDRIWESKFKSSNKELLLTHTMEMIEIAMDRVTPEMVLEKEDSDQKAEN